MLQPNLIFMKKALLLLVLLHCMPASSQSADNEQAEALFFSVIVSDIERSGMWYTDILGFKFESEFINEDKGFIINNMRRPGMMLELIQIDNSASLEDIQELDPKIKRLQGIFKIGMSFTNFDEWLDRFKANNINTEK